VQVIPISQHAASLSEDFVATLWLLIISMCSFFKSTSYTICKNCHLSFHRHYIGHGMIAYCFFFQDVSFTDDQCFYFMFPVRGGAFNSVNKKIRKHETEPSVSAERICIRPCVTGTCGKTPMEAGTMSVVQMKTVWGP
jgi:hypothetical protein